MTRYTRRHDEVREDPHLRGWWESTWDLRDRMEVLVLTAAAAAAVLFIGMAVVADSPGPSYTIVARDSPAFTVVEATEESGSRAQPLVGEAAPVPSERPKATHAVGPINPLGEPGR